MQIPTVPALFFKAVIDAAEARGCDREVLYECIQLNPELLAEDKARIPAASFASLVGTIMAELDDEYCGLSSKPVKPGTFAMMCYACINCPTLGQFLQRACRFHSLIGDATGPELYRDRNLARLEFALPGGISDPQNVLTISMLAITQRLASWLIDQAIPLDTVGLSHPRPEHAAAYNLLFRSPVQFDQQANSLQFSANYLDMPVKQNEQSLKKLLRRPGLQLMAIVPSMDSHAARITDLIVPSVASEFPDFEWVAGQLHTTTGTLRRRLRVEGTSYQQLKDDIRRDTAIYNLSKGTLSIEEVAASVGFSEPTSFFRAFRRWTGVTPRAYIANTRPG